MEAVCRAVPKPVIVAGSVDRPDQIEIIRRSAAGFTVGTSALDGRFPAESTALDSQLRAISACREGQLESVGAGRDPNRRQRPAGNDRINPSQQSLIELFTREMERTCPF